MPTVYELLTENITNAVTNYQTWGGVIYNVKAYGAKGDGATDDTTAIQAAIDAASSNGGIVVLPSGIYLITSSLVIGNGSVSAWSTKKPVILYGLGRGTSVGPFFEQQSVTIKSRVSGPAILIQGPILSWGVENIAIVADTTDTTAGGLKIVSGQFGRVENVTISGFYGYSIYETTVGALALNYHNVFDKIWIWLPPDGSNAKGVVISGTGNYGTAYEEYRSLYICLNAANHIGIDLGFADNVNFYQTEIVNAVNGVAIRFNYSRDATFTYRTSLPSECRFYGLEVYGNSIVNYAPDGYGSPPALSPNRIYGFSRTNNATVPRLYNLAIINDAGTLQCKVSLTNAQSIGNVLTKVALNNVIHDYGSIFDAANNRIKPTRPGIYRVSAHLTAESYPGLSILCGIIQKNGSMIAQSRISNNGVIATAVISTDVYMNGTTDYLELWGLITGGSTALFTDPQDTFLSVVGPFGL